MLSYHSGVGIETDLSNDLLNVKGSPVHIYKTIMNLVSNAAEAMPEGGIAVIKTCNCRIDKTNSEYGEIRAGDYSVVTVTDNGIGISDEDQYRIFEPFYTKKTMGRSGTGIGMAVVWGAVKDHGGHIHVRSELGKGAEIKILLPATREPIVVNMILERCPNGPGNQ